MKICIDAGHNYSGYDTGAAGFNLKEQDITFGIADKLNTLLKSAGLETVMTRSYPAENVGLNANDSINKRYIKANNEKCGYFISVHCNAAASALAKGTETLIYGKDGEAEKLAETVQESIVKKMNTYDRGVKIRTDLGVLKHTDMPAILIETAFITNEADSKLLKNNQSDFAQAIYEGICEYLGLNAAKAESGNDIDYALKTRYGITFDTLEGEKAFIKELDEARQKDSKLYWVYYKLANK